MKKLTAIFLVSTAFGVIKLFIIKKNTGKKINYPDEKMLFNYYLMLSKKLS